MARGVTFIPWEALLDTLGCDNSVAEVERKLGNRIPYSTLHRWYTRNEIPGDAVDQLEAAGVSGEKLEAHRKRRPEMTGEPSPRSGPAERLAQGIVEIFGRLPEGFERDLFIGEVLTFAAKLAKKVTGGNEHSQ